MATNYLPAGYHTATPYLIVNDCAKAIEYYTAAFGATELFRMDAPGGKIGHAEIKIGDSHLMLADEMPEMGYKSPQPVSFVLYFEDIDAKFAQAIEAGATENRPVVDQFYGDRSGTLTDPFGHMWTLSKHIEDVTAEEVAERMKSIPECGGQNAAAA